MEQNLASPVKIDSLCVDLGLVLEHHGDQLNCNHFTIRGYTADVRQRDGRNSLRISDGSSSCSIEQLPPISVPRFRYWQCHSCLRVSGAADALQDTCTPRHSEGAAVLPFGEGTSGEKPVDERERGADDVPIEGIEIPAKIGVPEEANVAAEANAAAPDKGERNGSSDHVGIAEEATTDAASQPIQSDQQNEESSGHPRRKARKVRLIQDLLCGKAEAKQRKKKSSPPGFGTKHSAPTSASAQTKRKSREEQRPIDVSSPSFVGKKVKAFKGDGGPKSVVVEDSGPAAAVSRVENTEKNQCGKHGSQRGSMSSKVNSDQMTDLRSLFSDLGGAEKLLSAAISATRSADLPESRGADPHSNLMPPPQLEKRVNGSKKKAEDPQSHQLFAVNLMKRKDISGVRDRVSDTELGLGLSLNYDPQIEAQVSVLPATGNSNDQRKKPGFLLGESSTLQGNASDLQVKDGNAPRTAPIAPLQEQRPNYPQLSQHQKLDFSDPHNRRSGGIRGYSDVMRAHNRQENIFANGRPDEMEIVELLAKNQYERNLCEAGSYCLPSRSNKGMSSTSGFLKANRNEGMLTPRNQGCSNMRRLPPSNPALPIMPSGENVGPTRGHASFFRKGPAFTLFDAFPHHQQQPSSAMRFSDSGAQRLQNLRYPESNGSNRIAPRSAPSNQAIEALNIYRNGIQQHEAGGNVWSSSPRSLPFAENREMHPKCLEKGKNIIDLDLNVVAPSALEEQNKNPDLESMVRASTEYHPPVTKDKRMEANRNHVISLDSSYSNEAIPAMQLLSLMDAGKSSSPFNMDGRKFLAKPFSPCHEHRSSSMSGKVNASENPHFSYSGLRPGIQPIESSRHFLSTQGTTSPSLAVTSSFPSLFQTDRNVKGPTSHGPHSHQVLFKPQQEKPRGLSAVSQIHCGRQEDSFVFPLPWHAAEDRTGRVNMGVQGAFGPRNGPSGAEICTTNENPADFTTPGPGNMFMINGEDLVVRGKSSSYKGKAVMENDDGRKRQRIIKFTPDERPQHHS